MKKGFLTGIMTAVCMVYGVSSVSAETLTPEERQGVLKQVEDYFNGLTSMKADFVQSASSGAFAEGTLFLEKEDKLRLDYKPPTPVEVVADGHYLIFHDKKLGQVTHMDLDTNPASFMLKSGFRFDKSGLTVDDVVQDKGTVEVAVYKTGEPMNGRVRLIFSEKPFALKQWQVTDAQQVKTLVSLINPEVNGDIDDALFKFKDPKKTLKPGDKGYKRRR